MQVGCYFRFLDILFKTMGQCAVFFVFFSRFVCFPLIDLLLSGRLFNAFSSRLLTGLPAFSHSSCTISFTSKMLLVVLFFLNNFQLFDTLSKKAEC